MKLFITGIGTDVGKTIASAIITEALQADYWKPIQAGDSTIPTAINKSVAVQSQNGHPSQQPCVANAGKSRISPRR
jgi:dethiobiotin synthetase